jgi:hypothetical protein
MVDDEEVELDGSFDELIKYRKLELLDRHGQMKAFMMIQGHMIKFISHFTDVLGMNHKQVAYQIAKNPTNFFSAKQYFTDTIILYVK